MPYRVRIDKQSCQSSGRCVAAVPGAFRLDGDHLAEPLPVASDLPEARQVQIARSCPALAISLHDAAGDEVDL
jgi:ferredoxin